MFGIENIEAMFELLKRQAKALERMADAMERVEKHLKKIIPLKKKDDEKN